MDGAAAGPAQQRALHAHPAPAQTGGDASPPTTIVRIICMQRPQSMRTNGCKAGEELAGIAPAAGQAAAAAAAAKEQDGHGNQHIHEGCKHGPPFGMIGLKGRGGTRQATVEGELERSGGSTSHGCFGSSSSAGPAACDAVCNSSSPVVPQCTAQELQQHA